MSTYFLFAGIFSLLILFFGGIKMRKLLSIFLVFLILISLSACATKSVDDTGIDSTPLEEIPTNVSNPALDYNYDEVMMYLTMYAGYGSVLNSLKNPTSAQFYDIAYDDTDNYVYFCLIAENSFGGHVKTYMRYDGKSQSLSEEDYYQELYNDCSITRSVDQIIAAYENISAMSDQELDAIVSEYEDKLENIPFTADEVAMYECAIAGENALTKHFDKLEIIVSRWDPENQRAYFMFSGYLLGEEQYGYASYSESLGLDYGLVGTPEWDIIGERFDAAEEFILETGSYREAVGKDIEN